MKIESLQVIHIQSLDYKGIEDNPLKAFLTSVNPFPGMTCSRHVYAFTSSYHSDQELKEYLATHSAKYQWLSGRDAYEFMLRWSVGAESHKIHSNDHFVLGQVRQTWDYFRPSNSSKNADLQYIMPMLFEDAHNIRRLIQEPIFSNLNLKELLFHMCKNCTNSRENEQKPAYELLLEENQSYIESAAKEHNIRRLKSVTQSMRALNMKASDELDLLPSKTKEMKMFEANLKAALEKKALQNKSIESQENVHSPHFTI